MRQQAVPVPMWNDNLVSLKAEKSFASNNPYIKLCAQHRGMLLNDTFRGKGLLCGRVARAWLGSAAHRALLAVAWRNAATIVQSFDFDS